MVALFDGLRDAGYIDRQNVVIETRFAGEMLDRIGEFANELVALNCDVIFAAGPYAIHEATEIKQAPLLPEDTVPELSAEPPITKRGDLWSLDAHRLCCGDARDERAYDALMNGARADFVFTDPPYNVRIDGHVSGLGRIRHREFEMASGEMSEAEYTTLLEKVFRLMCAHTENGSIRSSALHKRSEEGWALSARLRTPRATMAETAQI